MTDHSPAAPQEGTTPPRNVLGTVRLGRPIASDLLLLKAGVGAVAAQGVYPFTMNAHGAVCAVLRSGELLGLKPGEFEFVTVDAPLTNRQVGAWLMSDIDLRALYASALTSSQTDSSLRAAEPTTCEWSVTGDGSFRCVRAKGHNGLHEVLFGDDEHFAASSPTVTPPQTPTERESCARVCESRARSLREDGQHGEANEAKKCAAAIRARLDESPLRPIRAASPPVTEEAPNEDTADAERWRAIEPAIESLVELVRDHATALGESPKLRDALAGQRSDATFYTTWESLKAELVLFLNTVDAARSTPTEEKTSGDD